MTPALDLLKKVRAEHRIHSYEHDPKAASYGLEAAEKLGLEPARVFKTLLAATEKGELLVALVPLRAPWISKHWPTPLVRKKPKWLTLLRLNAPLGICWEASARWARKSACERLLIIQRSRFPRSSSAQAAAVLRLNSLPPCWPNTPRRRFRK
jgi:hypothetical protein